MLLSLLDITHETAVRRLLITDESRRLQNQLQGEYWLRHLCRAWHLDLLYRKAVSSLETTIPESHYASSFFCEYSTLDAITFYIINIMHQNLVQLEYYRLVVKHIVRAEIAVDRSVDVL